MRQFVPTSTNCLWYSLFFQAVVDGGTSNPGKAKLPKTNDAHELLTTTKEPADINQCSQTKSTEQIMTVPVKMADIQQDIPNSKMSTSECMPDSLAEALMSVGESLEQVPAR